MTLTDSLFNIFVLPFLAIWRTLRLLLRPITYFIYLTSLPLWLLYKIVTWPARTLINFMLRFDSLLPAILIVAVVGTLTGLTLHGLNVLLTRSLRLSNPVRHASPRSHTLTPTPSSPRPLSPFLLPSSPIRLPDSPSLWSPTKTNDYKKQMRHFMAQRQDQLVAMHEEEKRQRMVNEAMLRNRQDQQFYSDQHAPIQLRKPRLSLSTPSNPGRGVSHFDYDSVHTSLNSGTVPRSSGSSAGLGLGGTNSFDDVRGMPAAGAGSGFFFNDTILEEDEDEDSDF